MCVLLSWLLSVLRVRDHKKAGRRPDHVTAQPQKLHTATSAVFCLLEGSHWAPSRAREAELGTTEGRRV